MQLETVGIYSIMARMGNRPWHTAVYATAGNKRVYISMALAHCNRGTLRSRMELVDAASARYVGHIKDEGM